MSQSVTFSSGILILIESDTPNKWWKAKQWQSIEFIKAMEFGTMKTMGFPNPITYSKTFSYNTFDYRFIIKNDWGPCSIHNMTTGKERRVLYLDIGNTSNETYNVPNNPAISKVTFI